MGQHVGGADDEGTTQIPRRVAPDPDRYGDGSTQSLYAGALRDRGIDVEVCEVEIRNTVRPAIRFSASGRRFLVSAARIYHMTKDGELAGRADADVDAAVVVRGKDVVNSLLRARGFPAPEGTTFGSKGAQTATLYFRSLVENYADGICVKPARGNLGKHVYVGIKDDDAFLEAFENVAYRYPRILVERAIAGTVYRFAWVAGEVVAVSMLQRANVVGDGRRQIIELVEQKNKAREANPSLRRYPLRLDAVADDLVAKAGYRPESVLPADERIFLSDVANRHAGAEPIDVTHTIHPSYKDSVGAAIESVPGMLVCGADVIVRDASQPATGDNYALLDLNTGPGLVVHHLPWAGEPRDVAGRVVEALLELS